MTTRNTILAAFLAASSLAFGLAPDARAQVSSRNTECSDCTSGADAASSVSPLEPR